jgi:hypothetical protein
VEFRRLLTIDQMMVEAVAGDLVPRGRDGAYQLAMLFGDPAEDEEGRPNAVPSE